MKENQQFMMEKEYLDLIQAKMQLSKGMKGHNVIYLSKSEEKKIRLEIDDLAETHNLVSSKKAVNFEDYNIDRMWYIEIEKEKIPSCAFKILVSVPTRKKIIHDIMNLSLTHASIGYIFIPHSRIIEDPKVRDGSSWQSWWFYSFPEEFEGYKDIYQYRCDIKLIDIDSFIKTKSFKKSLIDFKK